MSNSIQTTGRTRIVILGASNVARGISTIFQCARQISPSEFDFYAAMGHGRSYGQDSRALGRRLPGILHSKLWANLDHKANTKTYALVTDVGNDLLYGASSEVLLSWVEEAVVKLKNLESRVVVTGLPLDSLEKLSPGAFRFIRTILFPKSRLQKSALFASAKEVDAGLRSLAKEHGATFIEPNPEWFGFDPIHTKASYMKRAWSEIFSEFGSDCDQNKIQFSPVLDIRLRTIVPDQRFIFGYEQHRTQPGWTSNLGEPVFYY